MRKPHAWLILLSSLTALRCNHTSADDDPEVLSNLRFAPGAFDSFRRNTELKFTLKHPATLHITIESKGVPQSGTPQERAPQGGAPSGYFVVKTLIENAYQPKGSHSIAWIGDTDTEVFAPAGVYLGVVNINNRRFETTVQVFHF